jgi:hypothetical protein
MIKWPIANYYAKKLPNGQAFAPTDRKNPGSGEYVPDPEGLKRLEDDHGEIMDPLQIVAVFILRYIHLLAYPTLVAGLLLTKHHGVPVANDCNGADIEENCFLITEDIHFVWHFCLWCLFREGSHTYAICMFINGTHKPWNMTESPAILFAELNRLLPKLVAKGVIIPERIRAYANQAFSENVISTQVQAAREAWRISQLGNQYAVGHGAPLGNTSGVGHGAPLGNRNAAGFQQARIGNNRNAVYNWTDTRDRNLIDGVLRFPGRKISWKAIHCQYFADWLPEYSTKSRDALRTRWKSLVKSKDTRIDDAKADAKAKHGDITRYFTAK